MFSYMYIYICMCGYIYIYITEKPSSKDENCKHWLTRQKAELK